MAKDKGSRTFCILDVKRNEYLVSYEMGQRWRFHAFLGTSYPSEGEAKEALDKALKLGAIEQGTYKIL